MSKLIAILGPTASGKSALGIKLAKKFNGEIISADSRQVYKGMDIGTGKVTKAEQKIVPHYLIDVASPKKQFTVSDFKKLGTKAIESIIKKDKLPFIVGGTAFYIYALTDDLKIPEVKPNFKLRAQLETQTPEQLFKTLERIDPARARNIDRHNKVRLIRAIEIIKSTKLPVPPNPFLNRKEINRVLFIGIKKDQDELYRLIDDRVMQRLKRGMVAEVKKLRKSGLSWKKLESFGLEYKFVSQYLQNELAHDEMVDKLKNAIHHFAKRQMTWFKKDSRIYWVNDYQHAEEIVQKWIETTSKV